MRRQFWSRIWQNILSQCQRLRVCTDVQLSASLPFGLCFPSLFPVFPSLFLSLTPCPAFLSLSVFLLFHTATRPFLCVLCPSSAFWWLPWCSRCHNLTTKTCGFIFLLLFVSTSLFYFPSLIIHPFKSWLGAALWFAAAWTHTYYLCYRTWFDAAFWFH